MTILLIIIISYLIGSIQSGILIGKIIYKTDVRQFGSKSSGATNIQRTIPKNSLQFNFIELNESLQLDIVKYKILLQSNRLFLFIFRILLKLSFKLYKVPILNMIMIRLGLLSAILQGYYKTKLSGNFKVT